MQRKRRSEMKRISLDKYLERLKAEAQGRLGKSTSESFDTANAEKKQKNSSHRKIILKKS